MNASSPAGQWGNGTVLPAGAPAGTSRLLLRLENVAPDGRPERCTVASHYVPFADTGGNNEVVAVRIAAGIGGVVANYRIDAGRSLAVNADALAIYAECRTVMPTGVNVMATVARGGEAVGRLGGLVTNLVGGGAAVLDAAPLGADAVSIVAEQATAALELRLLGRLGLAAPLWQTDGSDLVALRDVPLLGQPVSLQLLLTGAGPASLRVSTSWRIRA